MNDFEILGIEPTLDKMKIRRAFVNRVKQSHPDQGGDEEDLLRYRTAYDNLINGVNKKKISTSITLKPRDFVHGTTTTIAISVDELLGRIVEFVVPPLTKPGTTIEFDVIHDSTLMRICVTVNMQCNQKETVLNDKVVQTVEINKTQAQQGISLAVDAIDGPIHINVPPNSSACRLIYTFKSKGFFNDTTKKRGDLTIIVIVQERSKND